MTEIVSAVYDHGTLRLKKPIALPDGADVEVLVMTRDENIIPYSPRSDGKTPAEIMAGIAALPREGKGEPFSGRDHDKILYGKDWKK